MLVTLKGQRINEEQLHTSTRKQPKQKETLSAMIFYNKSVTA